VGAFRLIPPPRLRTTRQNALQNLRLRSVDLAVRVQSALNDGPERRSPGRPNRVTPPTPTRPTLPSDDLPAVTWTPPLRGIETTAADRFKSSLTPRESLTLRRRVYVPVPPTRPSRPFLWRRKSLRAGPKRHQLVGMNARRHHVAPGTRTRMAVPLWVACDPPTPPPLPDCDRSRQTRSQTGIFSREALRTLSQALSLRSAISRAPSYLLCRVEAAGIEPASADAPDRTSTSVVCALDSPGGRFADDLPTG